MDEDRRFSAAFGSENGTWYRLSHAVATMFPNRVIVEGLSTSFDIEEYARDGHAIIAERPQPRPLGSSEWSRRYGLHRRARVAVWDVVFRERRLAVVRAEWPGSFSNEVRNWIVADTEDDARDLADAVCAHCNHPRQAVLTFGGGCWSKSPDMWREVQRASFDDLVLAGRMAQEIQEDFVSFLGAREEYARYGVPWKRGVLFIGPPGNGKTHCLRASVKLLDVPCLYVQSLRSRYETEDANIERVFERAREVTPCCLVFEDLDAMITGDNRSTFLNQLDGFASAAGLLVLATTNHPEKLDPALLERPSRFDRKYTFALPRATERARYVHGWNEKLDPAMRVTEEDCVALVEDTDGFSFAYLKELFLASMIRWMHTRAAGTMPGILRDQAAALRAQMRTETGAATTTTTTSNAV
jgi:hypothetical protein